MLPRAALHDLPRAVLRVVLRRGQDLGQVDGPDPGPQPGQAAADMHQAGTVPSRAHLGPGGQHVAHLVGQHSRRSIGVLQREGAAEPAAHLGIRQFHQVQATDLAQQPDRPVTDPQQPQRVAGGVIGDPVRVVSPHVLNTEHVGEQLGQLVGAGGHRFGAARERLVSVPPRDHRVLVPDGADTRSGRGDDHVAVLEDVRVPADQRQRVALVAGIDVHLAAARLRLGKLDPVAEPLQQRDRGPAHPGEQGVGQAGHEQRDPHDSGRARS